MRNITHNPNMNAPSSIANSAPVPIDDANASPRGNAGVVDIPDFISEFAASPAADRQAVAASVSSSAVAATVDNSAPGMALTREQNSELPDIPSFLRRARPAHDGMKPETLKGVITIENQNIAGTP